MGQPAEELRSATYVSLEAVPPHRVAEIIRGSVYSSPRPPPKLAHLASVLGIELGGPLMRGKGGPGGWRILDEPELHLGRDSEDILVPNLAAWRLERMPKLPAEPFFTLAPDWICEVVSPATAALDRGEKMPIYATEGVRHAWLVDPVARTLEVLVLGPDRRWIFSCAYHDRARVRAEPFEAVEIDLAVLWAD